MLKADNVCSNCRVMFGYEWIGLGGVFVVLWMTFFSVEVVFVSKCLSCTQTSALAKASLLPISSSMCKLSFHYPEKFQVFLSSTKGDHSI